MLREQPSKVNGLHAGTVLGERQGDGNLLTIGEDRQIMLLAIAETGTAD